jgi:putative ABC transport system ATP-binding protein
VNVIEARKLTKVFGRGEGRVEALAGVSLDVEPGEWVSIIGPSGSGKSTLMNLLGLLDRPTSGSYVLDGREVSGLKGGDLARARRELIGFVFQSYNLLPRQSARKNVELQVGLSDRAGHRPPELSGGQKQRAAIARALVGRPAMLLADEPTGNLDTKSGEGILELFGDLNAAGMTLIVVTHDPEVARRGERVVDIRDGRVFADERSRGVEVGE